MSGQSALQQSFAAARDIVNTAAELAELAKDLPEDKRAALLRKAEHLIDLGRIIGSANTEIVKAR